MHHKCSQAKVAEKVKENAGSAEKRAEKASEKVQPFSFALTCLL
jgi:hypothetical protein